MAGGLAVKNAWSLSNVSRVLGLTLLLAVLLSINYAGLAISKAVSDAPIQLILVALFDTLLLTYFVKSSSWTGRKEWAALFAMLYGMIYLLTAMESLYVGSVLSSGTVFGLLVNGAITSGIFAAVLVGVLGNRGTKAATPETRLVMPRREWVWKIVSSGGLYLLLFIVFGFAIYLPLARVLDPTALASEQSSAASAAMLVFPLELFRGALWALLAAPAVIALQFGWKKTGGMMALLFAVPLSGSILLSTAMTPGLQLAHFVEVFGENLVFGIGVVWILRMHSRLPL
jgi:hypothetical protein